MYCYAIYDLTAKKSNPGHGFANTKQAIAFSSRAKRQAFLDERSDYDYSAKAISRPEAMKMLEQVYGERDKGLLLNDPKEYHMVVIKAHRDF